MTRKCYKEPDPSMAYDRVADDLGEIALFGDQLYVIDAAQDSIVTVYDRNGVEQKKIWLPLEPVKVTAALKEAVIRPLKENWTGPIPWAEYEKVKP